MVHQPAGRGARLWAYLVDSAVLPLVSALPFFVVVASDQHPSGFNGIHFLRDLAIFLSGFLVLCFIQAVKLHKHGQTIGKEWARIRIVRVSDGCNGGFVTNVVLRDIVPGCSIRSIPVLGALTDYLFIFRADRRCIHDLIAGTRVVKAEPEKSAESAVA
jgi:uncharacterized RDD family membrane protein YckC